MNRKELTPGTSYAYRAGKYGGVFKVRVVDTDPVNRHVWGGGLYGGGESAKRDGLRIVDESEGPYTLVGSTRFITAEAFDEAINQDPKTWAGDRTIRLWDGKTDDGEQILRVLPRYIFSTWAEHEAAQQATRDYQAEGRRLREAQQEADRTAYEALPEEYKEFIGFAPYDGKFSVLSAGNVRKLVEYLTEREATND